MIRILLRGLWTGLRKLMSSLANVSVLESLKLALEQKPPLSEEVSAQSVLFGLVLFFTISSEEYGEDSGESFEKTG